MKWIKIKDKLPDEDQLCWIYYDKYDKFVVDGFYKNKSPSWDYDGEVSYEKGFCLNEETGCYVCLDEVTHWKPYYTPQPPKENFDK